MLFGRTQWNKDSCLLDALREKSMEDAQYTCDGPTSHHQDKIEGISEKLGHTQEMQKRDMP